MKAGKRYKQAGNRCGHTVVDGTYPLGEMHLTDRMDYVERIYLCMKFLSATLPLPVRRFTIGH